MKNIKAVLVAVLVICGLYSSSSLADEKACSPIDVKEATVNVKLVVAKPLSIGSKLLVAEPTGSLKLLGSKGEVEKQAGLQDTVSIAPFEMNNKIIVVGSKRVHVLKSNLERAATIELPANPVSAGEIGEQMFGVAFSTGEVIIYDTAGAKKYEVKGILPNDKFPPYFILGKEIVIVGQNSAKYAKSGTEVIFNKLITAGAGHGSQVAVGDDGGQVQILELGKKKTKTFNFSGGIKNILGTSSGFLVFTADGKLTMIADGKLAAIKGGDAKPLSETSFSALSRNRDSNQTFAFASNGDIYQVNDSSLVKTKLKGSYEKIFSWGKDFVTYNSGAFQVLDSDGNILEQRNYQIPNSLGINQLQQNTFVAPGNPFRTITLAKNTKCQK